ncbi:MAG TPA: hypothetical protein VNC40_01825 [Gaiellaceae bacterium]|nr:hypothetical protein [Gaiellaceae bacterium]
MATAEAEKALDLPPDNAARLAIFDVLHDSSGVGGPLALTESELFERVIGRLRVLVPRELHVAGERPYLHDKLKACAEAGLISIGSLEGEAILALTGKMPSVRYPDGEIRDYTPGLELARERLDGDNARLRAAGLDVRTLIPSSADAPDGQEFQALLESMREHGFLKQFWIAAQDDDVVIDGRARKRAAAILELNVEYVKYGSERERTAARRRDTPLNRVMIALQSNLARLGPDTVEAVHKAVAAVTRRPWDETSADLALTAPWRRSMPPEYSPQFEVDKLAFRLGGEAKIQVTADNKVMLRSLIEAGGLSNYKINLLEDYVPTERARSGHSAGRKAVFARADDLISGIATMQQERRARNLKVDPEWDQIRDWLLATFHSDQE